MTILSAIIVVVYLALTIVLGTWVVKVNKNIQQFFVAKRQLSVGLIIPLLFSNIIGGGGVVGNASTGFSIGISSAWSMIGMAIGTILCVLTVGKFYRVYGAKRNAMTVAEVYKYRFDDRCRLVVMFLVTVTFIIILSATATSAAAILSPMLGLDTTAVIWGVCALTIILSLTGGLKGIAWMNALHTTVMYVCTFIVLFAAIKAVGGISNVVSSVPPSYFRLDQPNIPTVIAWTMGSVFTMVTSSMVVSVIYGAKSNQVAYKGVSIGAILVIPFAVALSLIGVCGRAVIPDSPANSVLYNMAHYCGETYGGLISMAVIAAILSSNIPTVFVVSTTVTRDLYKGYIRKNASEQEELRFSRIFIAVLCVVTTIIGINAKSILSLITGAFQIVCVTGIVLIFGVYWKRVTNKAAFWSMLVGGGIALIWYIAGNPMGIEPAWPGIIVTTVVLVVMTLGSKEKVSQGYLDYKQIEREYDQEMKDANGGTG